MTGAAEEIAGALRTMDGPGPPPRGQGSLVSWAWGYRPLRSVLEAIAVIAALGLSFLVLAMPALSVVFGLVTWSRMNRLRARVEASRTTWFGSVKNAPAFRGPERWCRCHLRKRKPWWGPPFRFRRWNCAGRRRMLPQVPEGGSRRSIRGNLDFPRNPLPGWLRARRASPLLLACSREDRRLGCLCTGRAGVVADEPVCVVGGD